jgi:hypothetical protein
MLMIDETTTLPTQATAGSKVANYAILLITASPHPCTGDR